MKKRGPKKRPHMTGPHKVILLADRMVNGKEGLFAVFSKPPKGLKFKTPAGESFVTEGSELHVLIEGRAA